MPWVTQDLELFLDEKWKELSREVPGWVAGQPLGAKT